MPTFHPNHGGQRLVSSDVFETCDDHTQRERNPEGITKLATGVVDWGQAMEGATAGFVLINSVGLSMQSTCDGYSLLPINQLWLVHAAVELKDGRCLASL